MLKSTLTDHVKMTLDLSRFFKSCLAGLSISLESVWDVPSLCKPGGKWKYC